MQNLEINPQFARALESLEHGDKPLLITGKAGTGKSTLLEHFRTHADTTPVVLAPTGVAALNVRGQTVHRFFEFRPGITPEKIRTSKRKLRQPELYKKLTTIIVDEASMLRADVLDCIDVFLRKHGPTSNQPFGGVRMVFVGDLYQLPPVVTKDEREIFKTFYKTPYFFSAHALEDLQIDIIELLKVYRQRDAEFIELLDRIRKNTTEAEDLDRINSLVDEHFDPSDEDFYLTLTATNHRADRINRHYLDALPGKPQMALADVQGEFKSSDFPTDEELMFKEGARIMLLNNDGRGRWVNGSIGQILEVTHNDDDEPLIVVQLYKPEKIVEVSPHTWEVTRFYLDGKKIGTETVGRFKQLPFRLSWAVTIHKSQGKTFDRLIFDLDRPAFEYGQTYVGLSRCTSFEGIVLRRPISASSIRTDRRVQKFVTGYHYRRSEEEMPLEKKVEKIRTAIATESSLAITYLKANDTQSERTIKPERVGPHLYDDREFLGVSGFCLLRQANRSFRVDRILKLEIVSNA